MVLVEIGAGSLRRYEFNAQVNEDCLRINLDMVEEHKRQAQLQATTY